MHYERAILHVDVNAAFLSWSAVHRLRQGETLDIRTIPAVIGGDSDKRRGIVLAKSDAAKKQGITTGETLFSARCKCPDLAVYPADYPIYAASSEKMYQLLTAYTPLIERYSIDECFLDLTGSQRMLDMTPWETAVEINRRIYQELGFTVNVGVGSNKLLAKMAGELRKPNAVTTLYPEEIPRKLWPLPVGELFMVGRKTCRALENRGICTIDALAHTDPAFLRSFLNSHGTLIWSYANGLDASPVVPRDTIPPKSYSQSATMPRDLTALPAITSAMLPFCETVASRMRRDGFVCQNTAVFVKYHDFSKASHQKALRHPTDLTEEIIFHCIEILKQLWNGQPVRQIGVRLSHLQPKTAQQLSLFDARPTQKQAAMDQAIDQIRKKYGRRALLRASSLGDLHERLDRMGDQEKPRVACPF